MSFLAKAMWPFLLSAVPLSGMMGSQAHAQLICMAPGPTTVYGGGSTATIPIYDKQWTVQHCNFDPSSQFGVYTPGSNEVAPNTNAPSDGSATGQKAFLLNDPSVHNNPPLPLGVTIHYAASTATLSVSQITDWNNNGSTTYGRPVIGAATGGNLLQIPTVAIPVTIPVNPIGAVALLKFTPSQLCGIFSGNIVSWSDPKLAGIVVHLRGAPLSGSIEVVYRLDGSGFTSLLTRFFQANCTADPSEQPTLPAGLGTWTASTSFASEFNGTPPANFQGAVGDGGVQGAIVAPLAGVGGTIGYLSPPYTSSAAGNVGAPGFPGVAEVLNPRDGTVYKPDVPSTELAANSAPAPTGNFNDPTKWIPVIPNPPQGYPIVGLAALDTAQCYQDPNVATTIGNFILRLNEDGSTIRLSADAGFAQLPSSFRMAVENELIFGTGDGFALQDPTGCAGLPGR